MKKVFLLLGAGILLAFTACNKEDNPAKPDTGFRYGAFVVNEGSFNGNNGSVSYIDLDSSHIINNLFQKINGRTPGDVVESFCVAGDKGVIVVNNSGKVEVVNLETFASIGTVSGFSYPRYALPVSDNKLYLTNGAFAGKVYVIDLSSLAVTDSIDVGMGPENLVKKDHLVYVANSGGWSHDSTVSVIDINTDKVIKTIITGDNPVDLSLDGDGNVWVLCKGKVVYDQNWNVIAETDSRLQKINTATNEITEDMIIGKKGDLFNPLRLAAGGKGGDTVYFAEKEGVFAVDVHDPVIAGTPLIPGNFYGLDVDPGSGMIYATDAGDYSSGGTLYRYQSNGVLLDTMTVGIAPNGVYFNLPE